MFEGTYSEHEAFVAAQNAEQTAQTLPQSADKPTSALPENANSKKRKRIEASQQREALKKATKHLSQNVEKLEARVESSSLEMEELGEARLAYYLDSRLWEGKAGAFGYQDGNDWLKLIDGTESNVVGLPLEALADSILARFSH